MRKLQPWATTTLDELSWNIPPRTAGTLARRRMTLWAQAGGSGACRPLLTTLPCHPASGRRRQGRTSFRRLGVVYSKRLFRSIFSKL
jgi:hypothetical protein